MQGGLHAPHPQLLNLCEGRPLGLLHVQAGVGPPLLRQIHPPHVVLQLVQRPAGARGRRRWVGAAPGGSPPSNGQQSSLIAPHAPSNPRVPVPDCPEARPAMQAHISIARSVFSLGSSPLPVVVARTL